MGDFVIHAVDPRSQGATELIGLLSLELSAIYSDLKIDGSGNFKIADVLAPRSVFLVGSLGERPVACGAYRPLGRRAAEIKRMFVVPDCRGRGYSKLILAKLEILAARDGYKTIRLETGNRQIEAIKLYDGCGYRRIEKFGPYSEKTYSICFEKSLPAGSEEPPARQD